MPAPSPRQRSEALEPADATAAAASRIVAHMNADHAGSLTRYLQHFGRLWFLSARSPKMLSIDRAGMKIASTGPVGTEAARGLHTTVTFEPPLLADLSDARTRLRDMDQEARVALGRKEETVDAYLPPKAAWEWAWWGFVLFAWVFLSRKANLDQGSVFRRTVFGWVPEWGVQWLRDWQPRFLRLMVGLHLLETIEMVTGKLRTYNVEFWSPVWWAWTLDCAFGGFTVWARFEEAVRKEREKIDKAKH